MGLETGTFIDDLVITNPPGSDDKRQGDDHLRLIKTVLKNTVKRGSKSFYLPGSVAKLANYTLLESDENLTIQCDTTTAFNLTLPVLDTTRAGWTIFVVKSTTDMNPVFIVPSSGTISSYAKIRRSVAGTITQVMWTGSAWVASRPIGAPIGTVFEYYGTGLPQGHLWADGTAINATNYVEASSVLGANTPDRRSRIAIGRMDMGGASNGLLGSVIAGTTLKAVAGVETITLDGTMIPSHGHALLSSYDHGGGLLTIGGISADHSHGWGSLGQFSGGVQGVNGRFATYANSQAGYSLDHTHPANVFSPSNQTAPGGNPAGGSSTPSHTGASSTDGYSLDHAHYIDIGGATSGVSADHAHSIAGSTQPAGGGLAHSNLQPSIICNAIVVAE